MLLPQSQNLKRKLRDGVARRGPGLTAPKFKALTFLSRVSGVGRTLAALSAPERQG